MRPRLTPLCLTLSLATHVAMAQGTPPPAEPGFTTGLWTRGNLLGDAGGVRSALWNYGITFGIQDINEVWGNVSGGIQRGADYDGADADERRARHATRVRLAGRHVQRQRAGTSAAAASAPTTCSTCRPSSGILATPTTRLWEVWYQQSFLDGRFDVKLGQQSLDQEFMTSQYSGLFLNTMMGWPMVPSADLYAGGPAYPLSSLGVRLRGQLGGGFTALGGVFQDNPPGGPFDDDSPVARQHALGRQFQPAHRRAVHRRAAVRAQPAQQRRDGLRQPRRRPAGHLQAGHVVRHRAVPSTSASTTPACRWPIPPATACR